ncbi:VOC family protein [Paenisporosarcina sp. OV554]|uniref:VOC family protein n=1 Tax=Paenisporosarcina sp. OV554 TaxID=2135694 RepID=UPI000D36E387|nr:VOC family protein [Paenisporosarcina sp. OV554]PUB14631.1 catechol 2,3-dioxygenase-like lactoylglutathione lyase family enzyme [Paenisporosarcina sp. OV554]
MMLIKRIDHIQLAAPIGSEDEARSFFQGVLSLDEVEKPHELKKNGGVWFSNGHIHIHVGIEEPFLPAKKAHPAFEVSDIDALSSHIIEKGVSIQEDHRLPGAKRFYVNDPFGNRLEFLEWLEK